MTSPYFGSSADVSRRDFLARGSMALACASVFMQKRALADSGNSEYVEVDTAYGRVRGLKTEGLSTFKGIP